MIIFCQIGYVFEAFLASKVAGRCLERQVLLFVLKVPDSNCAKATQWIYSRNQFDVQIELELADCKYWSCPSLNVMHLGAASRLPTKGCKISSELCPPQRQHHLLGEWQYHSTIYSGKCPFLLNRALWCEKLRE